MGSYAELKINEFPFVAIKNYLDKSIMRLFNIGDMTIIEGDETIILFKKEITFAKKYLDILGYNIKNFNILFDNKKNKIYDIYEFDCEYENYELYTFNEWLEIIKNIVQNNFSLDGIEEKIKGCENEECWKKSFYKSCSYYYDRVELFWGITTEIDFWYIFRAILEYLLSDDKITFDISELYNSGWINRDTIEESFYNEKIIVITEGKKDTYILDKTLNILFPEYSNLFYFMDFNKSKASGSVSQLVHTLKAFIGAGIKEKVIGLFDNDAAAVDAMRNLKNIKFPSNIVYTKLPPLTLGNLYVTLGPGGLDYMRINSMACSLELYYPDNILKDENGDYYPIEWKGHIESINKYQGVIKNKENINKNMDSLIDSISKGIESANKYNFENMIVVFEHLFRIAEELRLH